MKVKARYLALFDKNASIEVGESTWSDQHNSVRVRYDRKTASGTRFDPRSSSEVKIEALPEVVAAAIHAGTVDFKEFLAAVLDKLGYLEEQEQKGLAPKENVITYTAAREKIYKIIRTQLGLSTTEVKDEGSLVVDYGADEIDLAEIIMDIEVTFDVEISEEDADRMTKVGQLIDYVVSNGKIDHVTKVQS